jgi:hypothetical protein
MSSKEENGATAHTPETSSVDKHNTLPGDTQVVEVTNADYALALESGPKLSATSPRSIQLFLILLVAFMGSMSNGFDGQVRHLV